MGYKSQVYKTFSHKIGACSPRRLCTWAVFFKFLDLSWRQKCVSHRPPDGETWRLSVFDPGSAWEVKVLHCSLGAFPFSTGITDKEDQPGNTLGREMNKGEKRSALGVSTPHRHPHNSHMCTDSEKGGVHTPEIWHWEEDDVIRIPYHRAWEDGRSI